MKLFLYHYHLQKWSLKTLETMYCNSKFDGTANVVRNKKVTLFWVPDHSWIKGNEQSTNSLGRVPLQYRLAQSTSVA